MSLKTSKDDDRSLKMKTLKSFHQEALDQLGDPNGYLVGKIAYKPKGKNSLYVSLFYSEISRGDSVYIEFTDRDLNPENPDRCLYQYKYNPHFMEEYEKTDDTSSARYLIPIEELILIRNYDAKPKNTNFVTLSLKDIPMSDMSMQDYIAIHQWIPVSNKEWLNNLILSYDKSSNPRQ